MNKFFMAGNAARTVNITPRALGCLTPAIVQNVRVNVSVGVAQGTLVMMDLIDNFGTRLDQRALTNGSHFVSIPLSGLGPNSVITPDIVLGSLRFQACDGAQIFVTIEARCRPLNTPAI
jgi:hypothetical protein